MFDNYTKECGESLYTDVVIASTLFLSEKVTFRAVCIYIYVCMYVYISLYCIIK